MGSKPAVPVIRPHGLINNAWRWGAGLISAGAGLVSILSYTHSLKSKMAADSLPAGAVSSVRWVGITPVLDTASAIGDTIHLAVTATDHRGNALLGAEPLWASADTAIASVDSTGSVVTKAGGLVAITATIGGRLARARVFVRQVPAGLRVTDDSVFRVPEGERAQVAASVVDARGHEIPGLMVRWHSANPSISAVDSIGNVSATAPGRTTFTASYEGLVVRVPAEVYPVPASLTLLGGDGQRALAGRRVPQPVTVQVVSRGGRPVEGVPVRFVLEEGAGVSEPAIDSSDAQGIARATWTLGSAAGRQSLAINAGGVASPTVVTAEAEPVAANTRLAVVSEQLEGPAGGALPEPAVVRVTDSSGVALVEVPVAWSADDGGSVVAAESRTDSLGQTRARWTLGPKSGAQRAYVQVGSARAVPRFVVTASALAGRAATASLVGTGKREGSVGKGLSPAVEIRVYDKAKNPVPGVAVTLLPAAGEVADSVVTTDSTGRVLVTWTLGRKAGVHRMTAKVDGVERSLEIVARARPARPENLAFVEPKPGSEKRAIQSLDVDLTDAYGNAVSDQPVVFSSKFGNVSPARVMTDGRGRAHTRWTPASKVGKRTLLAAVKGTEARATFVLEPPAPPAPAKKEIPAKKDAPAKKQTVKRASR